MSLEPPGNEGDSIRCFGWVFCLLFGEKKHPGWIFNIFLWAKMAKSKFDHSKPKSGDTFCWTGPMFLASQNFPKDSCVVSLRRTMQENIVSSGASRFPVRHFRDQNDPHPCLG